MKERKSDGNAGRIGQGPDKPRRTGGDDVNGEENSTISDEAVGFCADRTDFGEGTVGGCGGLRAERLAR